MTRSDNVVKLGKSKYLSFILISIIVIFACLFSTVTASADTQGTNTKYRTSSEIVHYMEEHPTGYDVNKPMKKAASEDEEMTAALNMVKTIRYIAGINDDIAATSEYNSYAQEAADACKRAGYASHDLDHYTDICNLTWVSVPNCSLRWSILNGWMDEDNDPHNKGILGHRRWILDSAMNATGFGYAVDPMKGTYATMYVWGFSKGNQGTEGIMWPARTMPISYIRPEAAWSYSLCEKLENLGLSDKDITVTMSKDDKVWVFDKKSTPDRFYTNDQIYGQPGLICWYPDGITGFNDGDKYHVTIAISTKGVVIADYDVEFFDSDNYLAPEDFQFSSLTVEEDYYPYLQWTASEGATYYRVYRCETGTDDWELIEDKQPTWYGNAFLDVDVVKGYKYSYKVEAVKVVNGICYGRFADDSGIKNAIGAPFTQTRISITKAAQYKKGTNILTWKKSSRATGYKIYRRVYGTKTWKLVKTVTSKSTLSWKDTGKTSGKKYQYRIRAYKKHNGNYVYGPYSVIKTIKTK